MDFYLSDFARKGDTESGDSNSQQDLTMLISKVTHDFLEPLRTITGYSDLLLNGSEHSLEEKQKQWIQNIQSCSLRCQSMVDSLTEYAFIQKDRLKKEPTLLSWVVLSVLKDIRFEFPQVQISTHLKDLEDLTLMIDKELIRDALYHVIKNACTYISTKEKPWVNISADVNDGTISIAVEDNGIGIPDRFQEDIFKIFIRLHSYSKVPGNGMGLPTAHKIMQAHQGNILMNTELNEGSTFELRLPIIPVN